MSTSLSNVNVTVSTMDRKAIIALAEAAKANAETLKAIAEMCKFTGNAYGVYVEAEPQHD